MLAPGNGGELFVRFDKEKIESGPVKRMFGSRRTIRPIRWFG